jgi:hypothetical protein
MRCRFSAVLCVLATVVAIRVSAEVYNGNFHSATYPVELTVPRDWELSEQKSYPGILVYATHHKYGGRMTLAAQKLGAGETIKAYVDKNERALKKVGYVVAPMSACRAASGAMLGATTGDKTHKIVQAYLEHENIAYTLTIASNPDMMRSYMGAFCDTLSSIVFSTTSSASPDAGVVPSPPSP